jgi:predicted short-subunit dehydrogenase-like oxidoreductase (DUF2520 family)
MYRQHAIEHIVLYSSPTAKLAGTAYCYCVGLVIPRHTGGGTISRAQHPDAVLSAFLQGVSAEAEHCVGVDLDVDDGGLAVLYSLAYRLGGVPWLGRQVAVTTA